MWFTQEIPGPFPQYAASLPDHLLRQCKALAHLPETLGTRTKITHGRSLAPLSPCQIGVRPGRDGSVAMLARFVQKRFGRFGTGWFVMHYRCGTRHAERIRDAARAGGR
jgi:hypothetical protein